MKTNQTTNTASVDAAYRYLAARNALHKLQHAVPVIGRNVVFCLTAWQTPRPCPNTLPPLEQGARL
jgi:hypothetical protein